MRFSGANRRHIETAVLSCCTFIRNDKLNLVSWSALGDNSPPPTGLDVQRHSKAVRCPQESEGGGGSRRIPLLPRQVA